MGMRDRVDHEFNSIKVSDEVYLVLLNPVHVGFVLNSEF